MGLSLAAATTLLWPQAAQGADGPWGRGPLGSLDGFWGERNFHATLPCFGGFLL